MHTWRKLATIIALCLLIGSTAVATSARGRGDGRPLRFVAYTPTESIRTPSPETIYEDLQDAKQLGFDGVKLWDATELSQRGWLDGVLVDAEKLNLKVNVVFQFTSNQENFPPSQYAQEVMQQDARAMGLVTAAHQSIAWNSLFAPFDWSMNEIDRQNIVKSVLYKDALQAAIQAIKAADPVHEARVAMDFDPNIGFPLLRNADGYGIMPYDLQQDKFDIQRVLQFSGYFASENKPVYIDEWGLQTTRAVTHGVASSESRKASLVVEFAKFSEEMNFDWTYFMLTDRISSIPFENGADWGLLNMDRTPRQSGIILQNFLSAN